MARQSVSRVEKRTLEDFTCWENASEDLYRTSEIIHRERGSYVGNRSSGEGFTHRVNERRERGSRIGERTSEQDEHRERGSCVGKRMSGEGFTRRGQCVPRIVSFSATILYHTMGYSSKI